MNVENEGSAHANSPFCSSMNHADRLPLLPGVPVNFREAHPFDKRKAESSRILASYPERVPLVVERAPGLDSGMTRGYVSGILSSAGLVAASAPPLPALDRCKFLAPGDLTVGQFLHVLRKRIRLDADRALFLFVRGDTMPSTSMLLSVVYREHRDDDGFLYCTYAGESTFGDDTGDV